MHITDARTVGEWRTKWRQAKFRDAMFYVESDQRGSGRRVALHQYPKRNIPYAEDMGRAAIQIQVNGYVIGRPTLSEGPRRPAVDQLATDYWTMKNDLIRALEKDGPGELCLPMQFELKDLEVMVQGYTVTESRERGGMAMFQMQFVEYGSPRYRVTISTPDEILKTAATVENVLMGLVEGKSKEAILAALAPYTQVFTEGARQEGTPFAPSNEQSQDIHSGINFP